MTTSCYLKKIYDFLFLIRNSKKSSIITDGSVFVIVCTFLGCMFASVKIDRYGFEKWTDKKDDHT